jgi:ketosteroid isomerase-like protein
MCPGPITFEIRDLDITVQGDLGLCHYLQRCVATGPDGKEHSSWFRGTTACRRTAAGWKIVHEHFSAPFDPASGRALLDLAPGAVEPASAA